MHLLNKIKRIIIPTLTFAAICYQQQATSATQCAPGATCSAQISITMDVIGQVASDGWEDIAFGDKSGADDADYEINPCIFSSFASAKYQITASSANGTGTDFRMRVGSSSNYLIYDITFTNKDNASSNLNHGTALTDQTGVAHGTNCTNQASGEVGLEISITAAAIQAATIANNYTDTLTVTLAETS